MRATVSDRGNAAASIEPPPGPRAYLTPIAAGLAILAAGFRRTGSILPGMAIHIVGDLAYVCFGVLRADSQLLFVH